MVSKVSVGGTKLTKAIDKEETAKEEAKLAEIQRKGTRIEERGRAESSRVLSNA